LNGTGSASVDATTGRFLLVNEKFCEMTGYTCEELFQKTFSDITHPEDREQDLEKYREVLQSRALNFEAEKRYMRKDGQVRWVIVRGTIIRDDAGKAVRSLATIMDLTEWKENQQALAESEERLRLALDAGHFGAWEWIIPENRVIWSDRLYEIHGVTPKEFTGDAEQFRRLVHPEDAAMVFDSAQDTLKSKAPYRVEYRAVRPDGEIRWHWTTAQVFYDKAGNPFKMVGVTSDITDRKHIELQLRESEERLRLAQRAAKVNTWEWDLATNKISFSEGLYDLLSLPAGAEPPTMEEWRNYIHPDDLVRFANTMPDIQRRGGHFNMEFRVVRASGEIRWVLSIGTTEKDAQGNPIRMFGVNLDITERKKAEVLLQSQAQHLEELVRARTERLQEVIMELESFSYTIAHDLRGPLRAMNGFASALEEDYSAQLDNLARDYIRRITGAAERMDRLICDVLDYSKITRQPFEPEPVALDPLIDGIIETYPGLNTDDGALVQVERPLPVVLGTASLLVQCFSNLIGNAVKFVPEGITPRIQIHAEPRENGKVRIWVEDNGIGISADNHDRIFGLFQRLDKKFDGTGIGLAIVSRAVDRMGGSVGLESTEGTGSRFWVDLNLAECSTGIRMSDPANAFQRNLLP
jgi:PAS domain S-box-containing protein